MAKETFVIYTKDNVTSYGQHSFTITPSNLTRLKNRTNFRATCPVGEVTPITVTSVTAQGVVYITISYTLNGGGTVSRTLYFKVMFDYDALEGFYLPGSVPLRDVYKLRDDLQCEVVKNYYSNFVVNKTNDGDSWNAQEQVGNYYGASSVSVKTAKRGTIPTFNKLVFRSTDWAQSVAKTTDTVFYLVSSPYILKIQNHPYQPTTTYVQYVPSDFKDGVIPTRFLVLLQGGGGGGGYTPDRTSSGLGASGGGGGGFIAGVVDLPYGTYEIRVGAGGQGGYYHDYPTTGYGNGYAGGETRISNYGGGSILVRAYGGTGGDMISNKPGTGGSSSYLNGSFWVLKQISGGNGAKSTYSTDSGYNTTYGGSVTFTQITATTDEYQRNLNFVIYKIGNQPSTYGTPSSSYNAITTTHDGGQSQWNHGGGGGGASVYCSGGIGASGIGGSHGPGYPTQPGGAGGGGGYYQQEGADGAKGAIYIFY